MDCTDLGRMALHLEEHEVKGYRGGDCDLLKSVMQEILDSRKVTGETILKETASKAVLSSVIGADDLCTFTLRRGGILLSSKIRIGSLCNGPGGPKLLGTPSKRHKRSIELAYLTSISQTYGSMPERKDCGPAWKRYQVASLGTGKRLGRS